MNKIWMELENSGDKDENENRAALMTNLLKRLHTEENKKLCTEIQWSATQHSYIAISPPSGSYKILADNGEWFNLDYFGRV